MLDWRSEAEDKLKKYELMKNAVAGITEEIKMLEDDARRIRAASTDSTPVQGGGSTREDMLLTNIVRREELKLKLEDAQKRVKRVEDGLALLSDDERLVLYRLLIHPMRRNVERLREELGLEDNRSVYKRRDKALNKFTIAMYGAVV